MSGPRKLAASIIAAAVIDFKNSRGNDIDCYQFLTGKTDIAAFWFQCTEVHPLQGLMSDVWGMLKNAATARRWEQVGL